MCKFPNKLASSVTLGCPVQRNSGVKPARSTALKVPEFTPKLAPFSLKTHWVPERSLSFLTSQACGDLSPRYTAHINTSSTCHHPGLWEDLSQRCVGTCWRFIHILVSALISVTRTQLSNYESWFIWKHIHCQVLMFILRAIKGSSAAILLTYLCQEAVVLTAPSR